MIDIRSLSLAYDGQAVLEELSLRIPDGARIALMGPSGCGKTTLLRLIAGLSCPDGGTLSVAGRISCVFQEPRLFPWLTARQNIELVLDKQERGTADRWLESARLSGCADKYPGEMSGGQCQRVSILRALTAPYDILLLDEPLKGLDEALRADILTLIDSCAAGKTLVLATHDARDAAGLGARIYEYENRTFIPRR